MKFWTGTFFVALLIFLFVQTIVLADTHAGKPVPASCPEIDSPETSALHYQLFAAFETGREGYALNCSFQCNNEPNCMSRCQGKEGLRLLGEKLTELSEKNLGHPSVANCGSYIETCLNQCKDLGASCRATCSAGEGSLAQNKSP